MDENKSKNKIIDVTQKIGYIKNKKQEKKPYEFQKLPGQIRTGYKVWLEDPAKREMLRQWCESKLTLEEIAENMAIKITTLYSYRQKEDFRQFMDEHLGEVAKGPYIQDRYTIEYMIDKINEYRKECRDADDVPIISDLCERNDWGKSRFEALRRENPELNEAVELLLMRKEATIVDKALKNSYNSGFAQFVLKNMGWEDKSTNVNINAELDASEHKELLKQIPSDKLMELINEEESEEGNK